MSVASQLLSFRDYMSRCLYDPGFGYYSSGQVAFGKGRHFWTWPDGLSPLFGRMIAEAARRALRALEARGLLPPEAPLTVLELGAGEGGLAEDVLDHVGARAGDPDWRDLAPRLRYVIGDRSPALRARQTERLRRHVEGGRAEVRDLDARHLAWEGPFHGVVLANELLDTWPSERLRIAAGGDVRRVCVRPAGSGAPLDLETFWGLVAEERARGDEVPRDRSWRLEEVGLPFDREAASPALRAHLDDVEPLLRDLEALGALPTDLLWPTELPDLATALGGLLQGPDRAGVAILLDYGGTSRHVLDPRSGAPHLRVYGPDGALAHSDRAYEAPGRDDVTVDVDFTALSRLARREGLETLAYGHQSCLEVSPVDLDDPASRSALADHHPGEDLDLLIDRFRRRSPAFQILVLGPDGVASPVPAREPLDGPGLATLRPGVDRKELARALASAGLHPGMAVALKPGGDLDADLADRGYPGRAAAVRGFLSERGWLSGPGEIASPPPLSPSP